MTSWRELLGNERGTALALAMIILVIMTALALGLATMGGVESQISANQSAGARARQLAEAGIEFAFNSLANTDFSTKLAAGATLVPAGTPLPGLTAAYGTFTVTIRNDINASDALLTGTAADPGTATLDTNGVVILTSTGTAGGATRQITAVVKRALPTFNAALTMPGVQDDTSFNTPCPTTPCPPNPLRNYSIDGRDWLRSDTTTPSSGLPPKLGIAVASGTESGLGVSFETNAENAFSDSYQRAAVQGRDQSTGALTTGLNTIAADTSATALTPAVVQSFLSNLAANPATQILNSTQACQFPAGSAPHTKPEGLHMTSTSTANVVTVTNNCTGSQQINQTINLGSPTQPQLIYIKGQYDPTSLFIGLGVSGTNPIQGYGVLVLEDSDLAFFASSFRWDGVVLVTGRNVGVGFLSNSNTEIRGALVANETNSGESAGYFEFANWTTGSAVIRSSTQNINMALWALYNMRISAYREN
jgi:Tfp pilus assembly protein PilX